MLYKVDMVRQARRYRRYHHHVNCKRFDQRILRERGRSHLIGRIFRFFFVFFVRKQYLDDIDHIEKQFETNDKYNQYTNAWV